MAHTKIFHLTYTSVGRLPFFPNLAGCREALHRLARLRHLLVLFSIVLEHLHQVALTNGTDGSAVSKGTKRALGTMVATPFGETDIRTVGSRDYVENLFRYHIVQPAKHNVPGPPALWEGSCFLDLVGARWIRGFTLHIERIMPSFEKGMACEHVGLSGVELLPASADQILEAGAQRLVSAASAAFAAPPAITGNTLPEVDVRCAAAKLGRWAGMHDSEIAAAAKVAGERSVCRLRKRSIDKEALEAVRVRIALEDAVLAKTRR
jgi:hypothetical protein